MKQNFLIDIGHPAHVHLFKNFIFHLQKEGIPFTVVARKKEITLNLLDHYQIPYTCLSAPRTNLTGMFLEFLNRTFKILKLHLKEGFTIALGTSVSIGYLSLFTFGKVKSYNFSEDDDHVIPLQAYLSYPFSSKIINPDCIVFSKWKNKRVLVPSYHELAYLHPNNFIPDISVPKKYGLEPGNFVILRLSALKANHDKNAKGISTALLELIKKEINEFEIIESNEGKQGGKIKPWDMHHVLAFSKMIISDSQTMSAEGAVLGVPSLRINNFIGRISYLNELENKFNLGFGFFPEQEEEILSCIKELVNNNSYYDLEKRRNTLFDEKIDFNQWQIDYFNIA